MKPIIDPECVYVVEKLSHDGRGVARSPEGKTIFIEDALPGEQVKLTFFKHHNRFSEAKTAEIVQASPHRVTPKCSHFGACGGCRFQHCASDNQVHLKQEVLLEQFQHINCLPQSILPAIQAEPWHYRHKARLSVHFHRATENLKVGFRGRYSHRIEALSECLVLTQNMSDLLIPLKELFKTLDCHDAIPQLEIAVDDHKTIAIILRHLNPLSYPDRTALIEFARTHEIHLYSQVKGPKSVVPLWPEAPGLLRYYLKDFDLAFEFHPMQFTQINPLINQQMVYQAIEHLEIQPQDKILDLFCGIGNFSLAIARRGAQVVGVEGEEALVHQARINSNKNQLTNTQFYAADLFSETQTGEWHQQTYDKILIDPPRSGAHEIVKSISRFAAKKIVYVSCNPTTLARDVEILVHQQGYQLTHLGLIDMFPHTQHTEAMAVLSRPTK